MISEKHSPKTMSQQEFNYDLFTNDYHSQLFSLFIQTQKWYPISFDKICTLTWKLLVISSHTFSCELNSTRTYPLRKPHICRYAFNLNGTAWKVSKYGVFSDPYFPAFGLNTERCFASLRIHSKCMKIRTRKNSVFGHISQSVGSKKSVRKRYFLL